MIVSQVPAARAHMSHVAESSFGDLQRSSADVHENIQWHIEIATLSERHEVIGI